MVRRQWRDPHSDLERYYGLGTISGTTDGWDWFGHSGGLQGYISQTRVFPAQDLTVSVLTNAIDGWAGPWLDGVIHILQGFARHGAPSREVKDWTGRWWSLWGAVDLVPMGDKVLVAVPGTWAPFSECERASRSPAEARAASRSPAATAATASRSAACARSRARSPSSGSRRPSWCPEDELAAEMTARYERKAAASAKRRARSRRQGRPPSTRTPR